jgi:translation initiation factor 4E
MEKGQSIPHHKLIDKWNLYYHLPYDKNWDIQSYKIIMDNIDVAEKLIAINEALPETLVKSCMLFVMKQGILPLWEDPQNRNGGAFSFKIDERKVNLVWRHLLYVLCGNTLMVNNTYSHLINGISISPKKSFCIIKIWMKDCTIQDPTELIEIKDLLKEGCLFKKHEPEFNF